MEEFNEVTEELGLMDTIGSSCYQHINNSDNITYDTNCSLVYTVCRDLILRTQLTTSACLDGPDGHYHYHDHDHDDDGPYPAGELAMITVIAISQVCIL